jgi:DNA-binding SARP family transcriptional activator
MATIDAGGNPRAAPARDRPNGASTNASPPNVSHAIVRSALLDRLEARWDHTVTTVVAGAGFGKSVAVGQAMRANRARPRGVEGWLSCRGGCESPDRMASAVQEAFGLAAGGPGTASDRLYSVFADLAPLHASLVFDDVELLPDAGAEVLDELLRRAPSNLHLLLAGRRLPAVGLARFRAADDLVEIGANDLRFDDAEIAALAASLAAAPLTVDLAGWPALVRLALVAPRHTVGQYLWEEVIRTLSPADREALLALCLLGTAGAEELERLTGRPFDADGFCARVPLVHRVGDQVVAHDLWSPYLDELGSAAEIEAVSHSVVAAVAARGDPVATGAAALRLGDVAALRRASVELVRMTIGSLPIEVAESWTGALRAAGPEGERPEAELLECALAHTRRAADPPGDRLDAVADRFHADGDLDGEAVALAIGTLAADARNDIAHLVSLAARARTLLEAHDEPSLVLLVTAVDAAAAALFGDLDRALDLLDQPVGGIPPDQRPEAMTRLHWHFLLLAGRAGDAAALTAGLDPAPGAAGKRELSAVARWLDGDPSTLSPATVDIGPERYQRFSERDVFDQAAFVAVLAASGTDPTPVHHAVDLLEASPFAVDSGPDGALLAVARACASVVDHDDDGAVAAIARFVDRAPLDPLTEAHLLRGLAVPYVCSPELQRRWDGAALGPAHERARAVARLLVDARSGVIPPAAPAVLRSVGTALPLPWSVELATRAATSAPWGAELALGLSDLFGDGVLQEIARRLDDPDDRVRRGAAEVLRALPAHPPAAVRIGVLGPLEVHQDGRLVDAPELHRTRVRMLLALLVVERTVTRDRVIDLLWPDLDPTRGRANLRVTLRHLQRVLEPERDQGSAPYFVRGDSQQLQLADVAGLEVDCWQVVDLLDEADAARRRGDAPGRIEHLRGAVARWRGRPLPDLDLVADLDHAARHFENRLVEAALTLGELELVGGSVDAAATLAERVLGTDPYLERAHRLSIAARMQGRDRSATTAAVERLSVALIELGARPEASTQILLRNAAEWLGPVATPSGRR